MHEYKVDIIFDFMLYTVEQFQGRYELLLSSCKQYFFVSSQRVYADVYNSKEELDEHCLRKVDSIDEKWKKDNYGYVKGLEENILFGSIYKNWTIVRMSITFSKNRFQFGPLDNFDVVRAIRSQCSGIPDTLVNTYTTLTYGVDAANLLEMLILHENAYSEVFNISSKEFYTWGEVADIYKYFPGLHATLDNLYLDGKEVTFDASKVLDANESPKYRLELWNCYGATKDKGCAFGTPDGDVIKELGFSSSMEVKFTFHTLFSVPEW